MPLTFQEYKESRPQHYRPCRCSSCHEPAEVTSRYCEYHKRRNNRYGTPDWRVPEARRVHVLTGIALAHLEKHKDNPAIQTVREDIEWLYKTSPKWKPMNKRKGNMDPKVMAGWYLGRTGFDPKFDPMLYMAKAVVATAIEKSGYYSFPTPTSFRTFIGRMVTKYTKEAGARQLEQVSWKVRRVIRSLDTKLAPTIVSDFKKLIEAGDEQACLLANHLNDCATKPITKQRKKPPATKETTFQ
jgi:hypothetical protein